MLFGNFWRNRSLQKNVAGSFTEFKPRLFFCRQDYKGTKVIYPFYETLPTVEKFQADKADICIATFPKAGKL
jgi:hypothetical protein